MRYPVSVFECWLLVWVLLDAINKCTGPDHGPGPGPGPGSNNSLQCDDPVGIRVTEKNEANFLAGYVDVLCGEWGPDEWKPVCVNDMWFQRGARVVCEQLGFTLRGFCSHPCLGVSDNNGQGVKGVEVIECVVNAQDLTDCTLKTINNCNLAGVICVKQLDDICNCPTTPTVCPTSSSTWTQTHSSRDCSCPMVHTSTLHPPPERVTPITAGGKGEEQREGPVSCTAIGGGLGALAAGLGLALVGVVMGWVWHCKRNKGQSGLKERDAVPEAHSNPTYYSSIPSTQYSSQGPGDTPPSAPPPNPTSTAETSFATYDVIGNPSHSKSGHVPLQERVYHVLEGPGEGRKKGEGPDHQEEGEEEEGEYHVLGEVEMEGGTGQTYENPLPASSTVQTQ